VLPLLNQEQQALLASFLRLGVEARTANQAQSVAENAATAATTTNGKPNH
jgi:hypothetical protein